MPAGKEFRDMGFMEYFNPPTYSPFLLDEKTEVIPGLSTNWFWTSTILDPRSPDIFMIFFKGKSESSESNKKGAALCLYDASAL